MNAITINVTPLVGDPVVMHLRPLTTRVYHEVIFNAFTTLLSGLGAGDGKVKLDIGGALRGLDFDKFSRIASALLDGAVIEGFGAVTSTFDCEFFRKRVDVLYVATMEALQAQCPDLFLALNSGAVSAPQAAAEGEK